jgi:hypothetical protein
MNKIKHLVDPKTKEWFHCDERNMLHTCPCDSSSDISLCITITDGLYKEGEIRDLERKINELRKILKLNVGDELPDFKYIKVETNE